MAEAYHLPLVTGAAMDQPVALALDLLSLREYQRAHAWVQHPDREPQTEMERLAFDLMEEQYFARQVAEREPDGAVAS